MQVADGGGVFAVARIGLAPTERVTLVLRLGVEQADAALHAKVQVDEGTADAPTVVDAQLQFAEAVAAGLGACVEDVVVGAQVRQADVDRGLAHIVAMDHPLGAQLVVLVVAVLLEFEAVGHAVGAVVAFAVGVAEVPPAPGQVVVEHGVFRGFLVVADGVVAAAQHQLVAQAQWAVPLKASAPLLFAGAFLPIVVARQAGAPGLLRGVLDHHVAAADLLAGGEFHLRLFGRQAVELVHQLLDFTQVKCFADFAGKGHGQFAVGHRAAFGAAQRFEFAFHHQHLQMAGGEVLLRQIGTAGDAAFAEVVVGDGFEQVVQLGHAQALADVRLEQALAVGRRQAVGAFEFDGFDREATGVGRGCRGLGLVRFAGQILKLLEAPLLLFKQAVLPVADQVLIARRGGGGCTVQAHAGEQEGAEQ
ncbi:hypothetical protein PFLmoz3_04745 [Pseudomonas fluorescens]|uniref:Uncharacterized protein n=1 Tax=Pseudomonas fluorescens TaxID=294 RepID=A0A109LDJ8_PSEFL|nr:hypothetical protein PFLmoz3_04745 [Pseudomonas fluorescens]